MFNIVNDVNQFKICNGEWCALWVVNHYKTPKRFRKHIASLIDKGLIIKATNHNGYTSIASEINAWRIGGTAISSAYLVTKKGDFYLKRCQGQQLKQLLQSQSKGYWTIARKLWPLVCLESLKTKQRERLYGPEVPNYTGAVDAMLLHAATCEAKGYAMAV